MNSHVARMWAVASVMMFELGTAQADFSKDSSARVTLRNFYMDRDFKDQPSASQPWSSQREWAQGAILRIKSGYTEGRPIQFALDVTGMTALKLDSAPDRSGTGLLRVNAQGRASDGYSKLGAVAKLRHGKSELQVGTLEPMLPILVAPPVRMFAPMFRGAYLKSQSIDNLTLHLGHIDQIEQRDSQDFQDLRISAPFGRFNASRTSDRFGFAGAGYSWSKDLETSYFHAQLKDMYRQDYLGLNYSFGLGPGVLKSDFRYFDSREDGAALAGRVDSRYIGLLATYSLRAHSLAVGYNQVSGDTGFPGIAGTVNAVHSESSLVSDMANKDEKVWQAIYRYDFAAVGLPGLTSTLRYLRGHDVDLPALSANRGIESERFIHASYVIQSGPLEGVAFGVRQAAYKSSFSRDLEELRVNIDYSFALW